VAENTHTCSHNRNLGHVVYIFTCGAGTVYPSRRLEFTPGFQWGSCCKIFRFLCSILMITVRLSLLGALYCLSFFDLRLLITPFWYLQAYLCKEKNNATFVHTHITHLGCHLIKSEINIFLQ